ncbi:MAG: HAD family hydrolase, partial [Chitinophagaceae bacterium]
FIASQGALIDAGLLEKAESWLREASTVIWLADSQDTVAAIAIGDSIKVNAKETISRLKAIGITPYMLTGDNAITARSIAKQAGIDVVRADVMPAGKADYIESLQASGKKVAMVGDGINDSAALAKADVSIAMSSGSDIAMDVANMTIISSDLAKIPVALRISRQTVRTIRQNLFWAFIYNLIGIPLAAGILYPINGFLLNPMIAGAAMGLSSVSVVANSLLLKIRS